MTSFFNNLKIRTKIILITAISLILAISTISLISFINMKKMADNLTKTIFIKKLKGDINAAELYYQKFYGRLKLLNGELVDQNNQKIAGDFRMVDQILLQLDTVATIFVKEHDDFIRVVTNIKKEDGSRAIGTNLGKDSAAYDSVLKGDLYIGEANILGKNYLTAYQPIKDNQHQVIGILFIGVEKTTAEMIQNQYIRNNTTTIILVTLLITIISIIFIAYFIKKLLLKTIDKISIVSKDLAEGDLRKELNQSSNDEIGLMSKNLNFFIKKLYEMIAAIKNGTYQISTTSEQIQKTNQELAEKVSIQAASLQETSATMEQIRSIVSANTQKTKDTSIIMNNTKEKAEKIGNISLVLKESMNAIADSSKKIETMIKIIDEIALQTNILALNASIEAARAGDKGKGFAIVANQIKALALKSSQAAKDIQTLISESKEKTEKGSQLVSENTNDLKTILIEIKQINDTVSTIALGAEEQNKGIEQINIAINNLDKITQINASISEQTASSTKILYNEALSLLKLVDYFKT